MTKRKINLNYDLRFKTVDKQITDADLTDADTSQTIDFDAALPDEAVVVAHWLDVAETIASTGTATAASKVGGAQTYNLTAGDTAVIDVDNVGNATCSFDAAAGYQIDDTYYPVADQDGNSFTVTVDGGSPQTVTFSGATTTAAHVRAALNAQVTGVSVTEDTTAKAATKVCSNAETYNMAPGDTLVIDVDDAGNATATWDAAAADVTDTTTYPVADQDGNTEVVTIDGGDAQTVTFSGATTTATHVADQMNAQLTGCYVVVDTGQVKITTDKKGTGASVAIGTGTCALTWGTPNAGTGDVADIDAVTAAEVETVIEADTTATVTVAGGVPTIVSPTTGASSELDFISGNALTSLGLSVETIVGTASQAKITSDTEGTSSSILATVGDTDLVWNSAVAGTGDVADINAVTAAEVETVIEADSTATVTVNGNGTFTILSPTTGASSELDFISGDALTPLGLSVETVTGAAAVDGTTVIDLGISGGDTDCFIDGGDTSTAAVIVNGPKGVADSGHYGGETPAITVVSTGVNLDTYTTGDVTAYIAYHDSRRAQEN